MRLYKIIFKSFALSFLVTAIFLTSCIAAAQLEGDLREDAAIGPDTRLRLSENCELIPLLSLDAYGTYSNANSGSDVWGAIVAGSASPVIKYGDKLYLIPVYDGSYKRQRFFAQVEEGGRLYNRVQHHDLSLTAKYLATSKWAVSPYIFGGWDFNVETKDEDWGDGLYDYREFGSGIDMDYLLYDAGDGQFSLSGGFKWYLRKHPNYKSLISLATVTAPEEDEKDFNAFQFSTGCQYSNLRTLLIDLEYSLLMKLYTDKKVINSNGVLDSDEREEYTNSLALDASYAPVAGRGFQYSLRTEVIYNISNQNYYDSRATVSLTDDIFTADYFDYVSLGVNPKISYIMKSGEKTIATLGGGYNFLVRHHTDRKAQTMGGLYTSDEQTDYQYIFEANLEIPITEYLSFVTGYDYTINKSNMDYEQYYEYNYTVHRVLSGMKFVY